MRATLISLGFATIAMGCATSQPVSTAESDDVAMQFIADMDARPSDQRVPHWSHVRALMMREAPRVGERAPDFALTTFDGKSTIKLSEFGRNRPVVLIFGSWT